MNTPTDGEIVKKYVAMRDFLKARQEKFDTENRPYVMSMEMLEGVMATRLKERGQESVRTEFGTVYQSTTLTCRVADKEAFFRYVEEAGALELLAGNVAKDALKEHMEEHQGSPPPGVDVTWITKTLFRRA